MMSKFSEAGAVFWLLTLPIVPLTILGAADPTGWPAWANYGILGLIVISILAGQLIPGFLYKDMKARAEAAEDRERTMRDKVEEQSIPLAHNMVSATAQLLAFLQGQKRV